MKESNGFGKPGPTRFDTRLSENKVDVKKDVSVSTQFDHDVGIVIRHRSVARSATHSQCS